MNNNKLTIGMATYDDYDGVFFSIQSMRMYQNCKDSEFIVLDGNPNSAHGDACKNFLSSIGGRYIPFEGTLSSFNKYKIKDHSTREYVLIIDCHVLIEPGGVDVLMNYFENNPNCKNLIQGPLWYDDLKNVATHFSPTWRGDMFGTWATNKEEYEKGDPFEIPLQGMGMLAFEKKNWPGVGEYFKGFGAEEGYIAEKFRLNGGKNICIPKLKWNHRFGRPNGVKYPLALEDRIWNYLVGWLELYKDPNHEMVTGTIEHFKNKIGLEKINEFLEKAKEVTLNA